MYPRSLLCAEHELYKKPEKVSFRSSALPWMVLRGKSVLMLELNRSLDLNTRGCRIISLHWSGFRSMLYKQLSLLSRWWNSCEQTGLPFPQCCRAGNICHDKRHLFCRSYKLTLHNCQAARLDPAATVNVWAGKPQLVLASASHVHHMLDACRSHSFVHYWI